MKQGKNRFFFAPRDGVAGLSLVGASKSLSAFFSLLSMLRLQFDEENEDHLIATRLAQIWRTNQ